ncbi:MULTISPECIES: malonic semialdehyde reductase [Gluconobacter]|uniref:Malonic semialdehyde reductase n=7 Tax=Gluconobacter TaxID=441 RepID=A0AB35ALI3_GLUOY|nr:MULTISPECIES: malonic semialdehyde reductase [Gluconobacter]AAW60550.1 Putative oxidoreductase (NADH dehydrogenase/NAD(P)H nitroreductase) [Gluconobacter oxydans 621H]AHK70771.1 putative nitroreductase [Gluconobacter oxydans DSM 3504]KXV00239.1 malonic semialdehyde reductase [Gluconobacter potus]KXV08585.1 malonic semialdehyde reductase [Gluconobacter oxydans]KXV11574.1 malonic semialdehyde reductase [Gluconobacter oxydans]
MDGQTYPDCAPVPGAEALFTQARTPRSFSPRPVGEDVLRRLYDLVKLGPTSGNCSPGRFVFLTTQDARERIRPALSPGNVARAMAAPVLAVVCHDPLFFEALPRLNPQEGLRDWFAADVGLSDETAFRNGTLEGAYLIMAARMLGLSAMPMSGFDSFMVEDTLLNATGWRVNFLVGLGYPAENEPAPDHAEPRAPRLDFGEACLCL